MKKFFKGWFLLMTITTYSQKLTDTVIQRLTNEYWWGGAVSLGSRMPMGRENLQLDLYGDELQNQSAPLLLSNKGRWLWSEEPFRFRFQNDSLIIDKGHGALIFGQDGSSLREAYRHVSKSFFPSSGRWPDSLLVKAPQYNLWIELMYEPTQEGVLNYANNIIAHQFPAGVLMIDDNWSNYYGEFDFNKEKFPDAKAMTNELHAKGFKVMIWICPFISPDSKTFRELAAKKMLLLDNEGKGKLPWSEAKKPLIIKWWNGFSACLDLTNPDAQQWLQKQLHKLQNQYGIDGFKLDAGDAYFYDDSRLVSYKMVSTNEHTRLWAETGLSYKLNEYRAMWKWVASHWYTG